MDTLQSDINALEADKARLNERVKDLSKSNLLLQMQTHGAGAGGTGGAGGGGGGGVRDSPMLLQQVCTKKTNKRNITRLNEYAYYYVFLKNESCGYWSLNDVVIARSKCCVVRCRR